MASIGFSSHVEIAALEFGVLLDEASEKLTKSSSNFIFVGVKVE